MVKKPAFKVTAGVKKASKKENPFEKFANSRKKHEILNRRVKGEDRHVGRARAKAIDERKTKLLQDYKKAKKSNVTVDRRFGESDPTISLEEKMFMRFQQEKTKKARNSTSFGIDDEAEAGIMLTHRGRILSDTPLDDNLGDSSDDDDEEDRTRSGNLDRKMVDSLHFGGGFVKKEDDPLPKKGRLDMLQEIVMKSKMYKMQRKELKEEQEVEREKIDFAFDELLAEQTLDFEWSKNKSKNLKQQRSPEIISENNEEVDEYDLMMHAMTNESKARPADRTKTAEELAIESREKLEELEKARLKRMRENNESKSRNGVKRMRNDDELDDFGPSRIAVAHDDEDDGTEEQEEDINGEEDDDEGVQGGGSGNENDDIDEEDDESNSDDEDDYDCQAEDEDLFAAEDNNNDEDQDISNSDVPQEEQEKAEDSSSSNWKMMPHTIICPNTLDSFLRLQHRYTNHNHNSKEEITIELINRIVSWNNIHLPGVKGQENKKLMHNFLDILLKFFVLVAQQLTKVKEDGDEEAQFKLKLLDHVIVVLFAISQDLPFPAVISCWGRLLTIQHKQHLKQVRDYAQGEVHTCWPNLGKLLMFRVIGQVFSSTDHRHELIDPAALIMTQYLVQNPVESLVDMSKGLLCCAMLLEYSSSEAEKVYPEVLTFVTSTLLLFTQYQSKAMKQVLLSTFAKEKLSKLRGLASMNDTKDKNKQKQSQLKGMKWQLFHDQYSSLSAQEDKDHEYVLGVLSTIYHLIEQLTMRYKDLSAAPELFFDLVEVMRSLRPHDTPALPIIFQRRHLAVMEELIAMIENVKKTRVSLLWRKKASIATTSAVESKAPRFDANYIVKKDHESDKDRVKLKQLTRQLKREKKAAMRELRRDSSFLDQERFKEAQQAKAERQAERVKNFAWLEDQQATINQQVRKGGGLLKGGGSSNAKKPRVKR